MNKTFKALSDPTRRRILELLDERDMTAGQIADQFDMSQPSVSHHLSVLKNANLILWIKEGQSIIYSLNTTVFQEMTKWFYNFKERS